MLMNSLTMMKFEKKEPKENKHGSAFELEAMKYNKKALMTTAIKWWWWTKKKIFHSKWIEFQSNGSNIILMVYLVWVCFAIFFNDCYE